MNHQLFLNRILNRREKEVGRFQGVHPSCAGWTNVSNKRLATLELIRNFGEGIKG